MHEPVLLNEVLRMLCPKPGECILDGTLGAGGHSAAFLRQILPGGFLVGVDQDAVLLDIATQRLVGQGFVAEEHFTTRHMRFSEVADLLPQLGRSVQVMFFDIGVNSLHFDEADRGFSFRLDGLLDMRMDQTSSRPTAAQVLAEATEQELANIFQNLGDERFARPIARRIVQARGSLPIQTTTQLRELVASTIPRKAWPPKIDPATRVFQALRVHVNGELDELATMLETVPPLIPVGGRMAIIEFQSHESRLIKAAFQRLTRACTCPPEWPVCRCGGMAQFRLLKGSGQGACSEEVQRNPRSRSARIRGIERINPVP